MITIYQLTFSLWTRKEISVSWNWYEDQNYGLGNKFKKAAEDGVGRVEKASFSHAVKFENFREMRPKRFLLLIIYTVNEGTRLITVTSVFPIKRNPASKY